MPRAPSRRPVHPRVCGERLPDHKLARLTSGSSPRVRGTRYARPSIRPPSRFIPACAGNARPGASGAASSAVHPACAGNASTAAAMPNSSPVHPRVCGERSDPLTSTRTGIGSSPRVRGTRQGSRRMGSQVRFIPACAGNAVPRPPGWHPPPVHPRVCGERGTACQRTTSGGGSSPRVRGTHRQHPSRFGQDRFIPACAGNARPRASPGPSTTVHPRVCGERTAPCMNPPQFCGSSPRVRGTRHSGLRCYG